MLTTPFLTRLAGLYHFDRSNFYQKIKKKIRNKLPVDKMFYKSGTAQMPINLTFEMTHLCNLSCYMCDLYGSDTQSFAMRNQKYPNKDLLTLEDLKKIIGQVQTFKPSISLTGGEPMISSLTLPFIKMASEAGLVVTMTSNGFKIPENANALVKSGLRNLTLSVDGVDTIHDSIRGQEGSFTKVIQSLEALKLSKGKFRSFLPKIQFNVTICGKNQNELYPILELAHQYRIDRVVFSHLWYWDEKMVKHHNQLYGHIAPVEIQNISALENLEPKILIEEIKKIRASSLAKVIDIKFLPDLNLDQIISYYTDSEAVIRPTHHCLAPWMNTRILPNGDVIPCLDSCWGNLKNQSFLEAWNSPEALNFRLALTDKGVFPGCMRCCGLYSYE